MPPHRVVFVVWASSNADRTIRILSSPKAKTLLGVYRPLPHASDVRSVTDVGTGFVTRYCLDRAFLGATEANAAELADSEPNWLVV